MAELLNIIETAVYTVEMAGKVLHRHPDTVRKLCRSGRIPACLDKGGYLISGRMLMAYVENRLLPESAGKV